MYNKWEQNPIPQINKDKQRAIDQLMSLLEESDQTDFIGCIDVEKILQICCQTPDKPSSTVFLLKKKSDWFPPPSSKPNVVAFLKLVSRDIEKLPIQSKHKNNLTHGEQ